PRLWPAQLPGDDEIRRGHRGRGQAAPGRRTVLRPGGMVKSWPIEAGPGYGVAFGRWRTLNVSAPSVISIAWSTGTSRKVWVVRLVGQETVRVETRAASPRPMDSTRVLPPKLELLPTVRKIERDSPSDPSRSTRIRAPRAERLVLVP